MSYRSTRSVATRVGAILAVLAFPPMAAAFEPETITVETLAPNDRYRLYLPDAALHHIADGKVAIVDGAAMKRAGTLSAGMAGLTTLSPDRREIYIATNYFSRGSRGERTDVVEIYDALTLKLKAEIVIPPKHAQALPYRGLIRATGDGRYVLVQNATPATSVSIVDVRERRFVAEIATPGCWTVMPAQSAERRFSTLCGDGTLLTIDFDEAGKAVSQKRSGKFFDADEDPVFATSQNLGDDYFFVSFQGRVHTANLGGEVARLGEPWPLVTSAADRKAAWRPGGYQFFAIHADSRRLFVGMHPGGEEGTHKAPAREIWVFDLDSKKRLARLPASNATAMAVTQGEAPRLFVLDGTSGALVNLALDGKPRVLGRLEGAVEIPVAIEVQ